MHVGALQTGERRGTDVVHVGLLGYGNVGVAFTRLIDSQAEAIALRTGHELRVTRIAVRDVAKKRPGSALVDAGERLSGDASSLVEDPSIDIIVELIGGIEPARSLVLAALAGGKPVVTANKELLATLGADLLSAAEDGGVDLFYEASVAGAIPLVRLLNDSLAGERIVRVMGIVNGTTNYMLTSMSEEGCDYATALAEAQALGYAEADPAADVEGLDARAKAAILAGIAFDANVVASDVYTEGITAIGASDIAFAHKLGYEIKLLAVAERVSNGPTPAVAVRVHPAMVPRGAPPGERSRSLQRRLRRRRHRRRAHGLRSGAWAEWRRQARCSAMWWRLRTIFARRRGAGRSAGSGSRSARSPSCEPSTTSPWT